MSLAAVPDPDSEQPEPVGEFEGLPIIGATLSFTQPIKTRHVTTHKSKVWLLVEAVVSEVNLGLDETTDTLTRKQRCKPVRAVVLEGDGKITATQYLDRNDPQQRLDID